MEKSWRSFDEVLDESRRNPEKIPKNPVKVPQVIFI